MSRLFAVIFALLPAAFTQSVWFEPNQGQVYNSVQFLARSGGGYVYFARDRMAVGVVQMELVHANGKARIHLTSRLMGSAVTSLVGRRRIGTRVFRTTGECVSGTCTKAST